MVRKSPPGKCLVQFPGFEPRETLVPQESAARQRRSPDDARTAAISTRLHRRFQWCGQAGPVDGTISHAQGRMVGNRRYRYCVDDHGERRESLVDLERGPGETVNMAGGPRHPTILRQHRQMPVEWRVAVKTRLPNSTAWNANHLCRKGNMNFAKNLWPDRVRWKIGVQCEARFMSLLDGKCVLFG